MTYKAYKFSKSGKWHLIEPKTGKISCNRFKNADLSKAVEEKENTARDDKDVCVVCDEMFLEREIQAETERYLNSREML
ncbi:hypothetical protein ABEX78_32380 [Priestia megaterium]